MPSFTGPQKKRNNRAQLRALGHATTASAIAEIKGKIPSFDATKNYPKVNGAHPSFAALVLYARGQLALTFDHERPEAGFQRPHRKGQKTRHACCGSNPAKCSGIGWGTARA